ncbi:MAG: prolyl oligopeptidase family serine peptidase [Pseudonocardiaceae bacterium]
MTCPSYPPARRISDVEDIAGQQVSDPYRWLEDDHSDESREWSAAQDALFRSARDTWTYRSYFRERLSLLSSRGWVSAPLWRGRRQFLTRLAAGADHPVLVVVDPDGTENVLLDPALLDPSGKTTLAGWRPSWEGDLLAYQLCEQSSEKSLLWVMDVAQAQVVDGPVARTRFSPIAWLPGGAGFYYVSQPDPRLGSHHGQRVWWHRIGADSAGDRCVFGEDYADGSQFAVSVSADGRWLSVSVAPGAAARNDLWLADLSHSDPQRPDLRIVQWGAQTNAQASFEFGGQGRIYVRTDRDAPNGRICLFDPRDPSSGTWPELIPQEPDAVLDDCVILDGAQLDTPVLVVARTRHAVSELSLHDPASGARLGEVPLPGAGSVQGIRRRPGGGHEIWFTYTDHTSPPTVYRYDARDGRLTRWTDPPTQVSPSGIHTRQVVYPAQDRTAVRMFVIAPEAEPSRPRPTIVFAYGGFGLSLRPAYSPIAQAWVQAGGVYAVANVRGGGEQGARWHHAGQGRHKQNTFDDVHAAAQWLIHHGWTSPDRLVFSGGSHGGLVAGAMLTQHPDSCAAVVCSGPVLDMVRYEQFGLGRLWADEFGTAADPEQIEWLLSYSPYHRVREGTTYPATLFTCPDVDPRVDAMHVRKMAAALQHATTSPHPVLIRRQADVGHSTGSASSTIELGADILSFAAAHTGLVPTTG